MKTEKMNKSNEKEWFEQYPQKNFRQKKRT